MKLKYNKVELNRMLLFGIAFNVIGIISLFTNPIRSLFGGFVGMGSLYMAMYVYMLKNQYATIDNDAITKHIVPVQNLPATLSLKLEKER